MSKAKQALDLIQEAVQVRAKITELYKQYRDLSNTACLAAQLNHRDLKRAVDALYYLGGGWPSPTSKGRMEALLENFVGMYRILDFIGKGTLVVEHLTKFGVKVSLDREFKIENAELTVNEKKYLESNFPVMYHEVGEINTIRDLVRAVIAECEVLQGEICQLADTIKDNLKPAAQKHLELEDAEYDRLHAIVRMTAADTPRAEDKAQSKKVAFTTSVTGFHAGLAALGSQRR